MGRERERWPIVKIFARSRESCLTSVTQKRPSRDPPANHVRASASKPCAYIYIAREEFFVLTCARACIIVSYLDMWPRASPAGLCVSLIYPCVSVSIRIRLYLLLVTKGERERERESKLVTLDV